MAIRMRRGLKDNFDPTKLLPGEWAVTIDSDTKKQIVYMCFAAGVVKRMGTLEDFDEDIQALIKTYLDSIEESTDTCTASAASATASAESASMSETNALSSATSATTSEVNASKYAENSESYAIGGTGTRTGEDTDNAKYYMEQASRIVSSVSNALRPMGTILFASLPTSGIAGGDMYNISDQFISDNRFKDGGDKDYPAGSNIYYTQDGYWDVLQGDMANYLLKTGDSQSNVVSFGETATLENIATGETHGTLFGKVKKAISSLIALITTVGSTDISGIGDGTVTGAISATNSSLEEDLAPKQLLTSSLIDGQSLIIENWKDYKRLNVIFTAGNDAYSVPGEIDLTQTDVIVLNRGFCFSFYSAATDWWCCRLQVKAVSDTSLTLTLMSWKSSQYAHTYLIRATLHKS